MTRVILTFVSTVLQWLSVRPVSAREMFLTGRLWSLCAGSNTVGSCRAEESGLQQDPSGAELDRGQWLSPLESWKNDGVGKREKKDALYEAWQREKRT